MNKFISNSIIACFLIYTLFISNFAFVAGSNILDNDSMGNSVKEIVEVVNEVVGDVLDENVSEEVVIPVVEFKENVTESEEVFLNESESLEIEENNTLENLIENSTEILLNETEEINLSFNNFSQEENVDLEINSTEIIEDEKIIENNYVGTILENVSLNSNLTEGDFEIELIQLPAKVGENVRWVKRVYGAPDDFEINIPSGAEKVEMKKTSLRLMTALEPEIKNYTEIIYETSAPMKEEKSFKDKKEVLIYSEYHYENVTVKVDLDFNLSVDESNKIKIYWKEEKVYINFDIKDIDSNGFIDSIEWIVPHLSNQTFDIILISDAQHLDENKNFIENIYDEVSSLDDVWSSEILDSEYVRILFERELDNTKDITIYPRVLGGAPRIEVYEIEGNDLIAEFTNLVEGANKIYLTNLIGLQDTFDLKVVGGSVQFDYIIDPLLGLFFENWEAQNFNNWINTAWTIASDQYIGTRSAKCATNANCDMNTNVGIDTSLSTSINVTFSYRDDDCDSDDVILYFNDSSGNWDNMGSINALSLGAVEDTWNTHTVYTTDSQYQHPGFAIRFWADPEQPNNPGSAENYWIDNINITIFKPNFPPTTPTEITCDGSTNCNISTSSGVTLNATGSVDGEFDIITYIIEKVIDGLKRFILGNYITFFGKGTAGATDYTLQTCDGMWGFNCATQPDADNTFDACPTALQTDEKVVNMTINTTTVASGESINVTCYFDPYTDSDDAFIWYYNGTGWKKLFENINWGSTSTYYPESVVFTPDEVVGVQWVRCSINYISGSDSDECMDSGTYYDNDDMNFTFVSSDNPSSETNTTYTTYTEVGENYGVVDNITIMVEVDSYNPEASVEQSTSDPDLFLEIYDGNSWNSVGNFDLPSSYGGTGLDTTNRNFTLIITNSTILTAWENDTNQNLRIKGILMDYYNTTVIDEINYTNVFVDISGFGWSEIGNHTEGNSFFWNTTLLEDSQCINLRTRAIDLAGSNTFTDYFTKNSCLNIDNTNPLVNYATGTEEGGTFFNRNWIYINAAVVDSNFKNISFDLYNSEGFVKSTIFTNSTRDINWTSLVDDLYFYNVSVYDVVNHFNFTETRNITLDTKSPLISYGSETKVNAINVSQNFIYVDVNVVEDNEANITFELYNSSGLINQSVYTNGVRNINWTNLQDGIYFYNVIVVDILGRINFTQTRTLELDTTFPLVNFGLGTEENDSGIMGESIFVNVSVVEKNEANITFTLYNFLGEVERTNTFDDKTRSLTWTLLSDGIYFYNVSVVDVLGQTNYTETRRIVLDNVAPVIDFGLGIELDNVNKSQSWIFVNTTITETNFENITFRLYNLSGIVNETTYTILTKEINWSGLIDGEYSYNVTVFDKTNQNDFTETRKITLDMTVPSIEFGIGTEDNESIFKRDWIYINVSATDLNFKNITFDLYDSGGLVNKTAFTDSTRNINFINLPSTIYYYNVSVYDFAGNLNFTETRSIGLDTIGPSVNIVDPKAKVYGYNVSLPLNTVVTDNIVGVDSCWWNLDNGVNQSIVCGTNTTFDTDEDAHTIYFYSNDSFGNLGFDSVTFLVSTTGPATTLIIPENDSFYSVATNILFNYTSEDPDSIEMCSIYGDWKGIWHLNQTANDWIYLGEQIFFEDFEMGEGEFTHGAVSGGVDDWHRSSESSNDGTYSFKEGDTGTGNYSDNANSYLQTVVYPIYENAVLSFYHYINTEAGYDGGKLEYMVDESGTWNKVDSFISGGYNGVINNWNNIVGFTTDEAVWDGTIGSAGTFSLVEVNLSSIDAENITFRFRFASDTNTNSEGWYIDSINFTSKDSNQKIFGNFTVHFSEEGNYNWNIECNDTIGYSSFALSNYTLTIDVTNPQVFFGSGTIENDTAVGRNWIYVDANIIENNFKNITFSLYNSTSFVKENIYDDSTRNVNFTELGDGEYYYNISVYDKANRIGNSETRKIILDTEAAEGQLISPSSGSYVKDSNQNLTANFSDGLGLKEAILFIFNSTGNLIYTSSIINLVGLTVATVGVVYEFLQDGIFSWFYQIEDSVGNLYNTTNNSIIIDTTLPTIAFIPTTEDSGSVFERNWVYLNISVDELYFKNLTFNLYNGEGIFRSNSYTTLTRDINWTLLVDDLYFYNVSVFDLAGNINYSETRNISLDNTNPVVDFGIGTIEEGGVISGEDIFVNVTVDEPNEANITFRLFDADQILERENTFSDFRRTINWNLISEGVYFYNVSVYDVLGHLGYSSTRTIEIDNTYPVVDFGVGTEINNANKSQSWVYVNTSVVEKNFENITFYLYNLSGLVNETSFNDSTRQINWTNLLDGTYYYNFTVYDKASLSSSSNTLKINLDKTLPLIQFGIGTENTEVNRDRNWIYINVSATDLNFKNITFDLYDSEGLVNETVFTDSTRSINFTNLPSTIYYYNVSVYDFAGNLNSTETRSIGLDQLGPSILISDPKSKAYGYNVSLPLNTVVTDNIVGVDSCWWNLDNNANESVSCSGTTFDTTDGVHTIHFYANDTFGYLSYENVTFSVSVTGPAISLTNPTDNTFYSQATQVVFNYSAEDPDLVESCSLYGSWNGGWHLNQTDFDWIISENLSMTDDFESSTFNNWINTAWTIASDQYIGTRSAKCAVNANCDMNTNVDLDTTHAISVNVTFNYRDDDCDAGDVILYFNDSSGNWDNMGNINALSLGDAEDTWNTHTIYTTDIQYQHSGFAVRFWADPEQPNNLGSAENYWIDNVLVNYESKYSKPSGNFTVNLYEEGTQSWNVECNDTLGYDKFAFNNFSFIIDVTNPIVDFGIGTLNNNSNVSQNFVYVNSSIVENNFKNMTFRLYNSTSIVKTSFFNDTTRSVNWTSLSDGKYYYNITVYDKASRVGISGTREILLDTKFPSGNLGSPTSGGYVNNVTQNLTASFSDENGLKEAILFVLNSTGQIIYSDTISLIGLFSTTVGLVYEFLEEGIFSWFYQAEDSVGNKFNTTSNNLTVDITKPIIEFISPTKNSGVYVTNNFIILNTSVTEINYKNITFDLYKGSSLIYSNPFTNSKRDINWTLLSDGIYYYNVTVYDLAGNVNNSETRNITLDNILPSIVYSTGTEANNANKSQNWIYVNTSVVETNFANITFRLYNGIGLLDETTYYNSTRDVNWSDFSVDQDEEYYYNVTVYDKAGLSSSLSTRKINLDTIKPLVSYVGSTSPSGIVAERDWIFIDTAIVETNFKNITYGLYGTTGLINSTTYLTYVPNINFSVSSENKTYYYNVTVYDFAGNFQNTLTNNITLIDITNPSLILISPQNKTYSYNTGLRLSYEANDLHLDKCWYNLDGGSNITLPNCQDTTLNVADEMSHTIKLFVNDTLGYMNSSNVTFFVNSSLIETPTYQVISGQSFVDGYVEASLSQIDSSKAFILHSTQGGDNGPDSLQVTSDFLDANTIAFENYPSGEPVISEWSVVVGPNISVQRGEISYTNETFLDVGINSINLSNSFLIVKNRLNSGDSIKNIDGYWSGKFVDSSNLGFNRSSNSSSGVLSWQVVSWNDIVVSSGQLVISDGQTTNTTTISSVDLNNSFLLFLRNINGSQNIEDSFVKGDFLDESNIKFNRVGNKGNVTISYFIISSELFNIQSGNYNHALSVSEQNVDLPDDLINFSRTFIVNSNNNSGSGTAYSTAYVTNKVYDNDSLIIQKGSSFGSGTSSWFTIEMKDLNNPNITLISPTNNYNYSTYLIPSFNYSFEDENNLTNCSLYGNWSTGWHLNQTVSGSRNFTSVNVSNKGFYKWGVVCYDIYGNKGESLNYTFGAFLPTTEPLFVNMTQSTNDGTGNIFFDWGDTIDALSYRIYSGENISNFTLLDEVTVSNYTDTTFAGNRRRFYKVEAWNPSSNNMSEKIIGAHVYTLKHNVSATNSIKNRNWIGFPTNFSYLENANDTLNEVTGITAVTKFDSITQKKVTCSEFSCPVSFSCTDTACNFDLQAGAGYEVELDLSGGSEVNWSGVGIVYSPQDITLLFDETLTRTNKNWISMMAFTSLEDARDLSLSLLGEDTLTNWNVTSQKSEGLIQLFPGFFVGTNFEIEMEKSYEISVTQDSVWTQE